MSELNGNERRTTSAESDRLRRMLQTFKLTPNQAIQLKPGENVMFVPDIAYVGEAEGIIHARVQAWVYGKEKLRALTKMFALILGVDMAKLSADERQRLYERTQYFRVDCKRGRRITVRSSDGQVFGLTDTTSNGRTTGLIRVVLPDYTTAQKVDYELYCGDRSGNRVTGHAHFAPERGLSVISDIDDTIKETGVHDRRKLLINTFLKDFVETDGMSEWYRSIVDECQASFHYVSSSPIQLFPILYQFLRDARFPLGSMHLRETTRWSDILPKARATINHKSVAIRQLLDAFPKRRFILIGDANEHDPYIYADIARQNPEKICCVLIRDLPRPTRPVDYHRIFAGIDQSRWCVSASTACLREFSQRYYCSYNERLV